MLSDKLLRFIRGTPCQIHICVKVMIDRGRQRMDIRGGCPDFRSSVSVDVSDCCVHVFVSFVLYDGYDHSDVCDVTGGSPSL